MKINISFISSLLLLPVVAIAQTAGGIFEPGPLMNSTRIAGLVNETADGEIMFVGGREYGFISCDVVDVYDPESNSFEAINMLYPHDNTALVNLPDGDFLVFGGGYDYGVPGYQNVERFDAGTRSFVDAGLMYYARMWAGAALLTGGDVLIAGAWYNNVASNWIEGYDPETMTTSFLAYSETQRAGPLVLPDNHGGAMIIGGFPPYGGDLIPSVEYYDPVSGLSLFASELVPGEPKWATCYAPYNYFSSNILLMNNGKYVFTVYNTLPEEDEASVGLMTFDPETKEFELLDLSGTLKNEYADGGFSAVAYDAEDNLVYFIGIDEMDYSKYALLTVNIATGEVYYPTEAFTMPTGEYLSLGSAYFVDATGFIVFGGVTASMTDYFNATNKTYLITPDIQVEIADQYLTEHTFSIVPNPARDNIQIRTVVNAPGSYTIRLVNNAGQVIFSTIHHAGVAGSYTWTIPAEGLPEGIYQVVVEGKHMPHTEACMLIQ